MGNLISRKALLAKVVEANPMGGMIGGKFIEDLIKTEPTAYDVDKVVEKIREQDGVCTGCKRQDECNECSIGERIEIIKRGGLDE